jgi:general secretion pathway protein N
MKKLWTLAGLGILAYLIFALFTLPAASVLARFESAGLRTAGVEGSLWKGTAQVVQFQGANLGMASWNVQVLRLFTGRLSADVQLSRDDRFAQLQVSLRPSGRVELSKVTASMPLSALPANLMGGGWAGSLNLTFSELQLQDGWPISGTGVAEVVNLVGPVNRPAPLGGYQVEFPAPNAPPVADALIGSLSDTGGPLEVTGTVQLKRDRSYLIKGLVATRPDAPRDISNTLQFLGAPDAKGRREFSLEGTM